MPVRLELLGAARVLRDGAPCSGLGKKTLALVAYLASPVGKAHNRDQLAGLLWPDRFDEQARQSLRQALTQLRKAFGEDAVGGEDGGVAFAADKVESAAAEFEALARARDLDSLKRAAALYRGDFLETLGAVSPEFDDWAELERRRLRDLFLDALETLARGELEVGHAEEALAAAQRLLERDPANEAGCRAAMNALARLGRRSAALRQFETCKAALKRTLDAAPSPETVELAERIQRMPESETPDLPSTSGAPRREAQPGVSLWKRVSPRTKIATLLGGVALVAVIGTVALRGRDGDQSHASACAAAIGLPAPGRPTIAVLPLRVEGADAGTTDFAAAATTRIGDLLGDIPALTVKAAPSGSLEGAPGEIAQRIGVSHLIEGDVRREGDELQVSVRLIDAATGAVLQSHARSYDVSAAARRSAQDAIAIATAEAVQVHLTEGEQALQYYAHETASLEVFQHLTRASQYFNRKSRAYNARAREEYSAARALDPNDPRATSGMGWTYVADALFGWSQDPAEDLARAKALAEEAIADDASGAFFYPHSLLSVVALLEGDHVTARARGEEALRLSGSGADAAAVHALVLTYLGETARSEELAKMAMRRRQRAYPDWYEWVLGRAARMNGETELALACLPAQPVGEAGFAAPIIERAAALAATGDAARAHRDLDALSGLSAEAYCARPPYANAELTARCVADVRRAGLP